MKRKSLQHFNFVIFVFSILFAVLVFDGCLFNIGGGEPQTHNEVIKLPNDYSDNKKIENAILQVDFDNFNSHKVYGKNCFYKNDEILAKWRNKSQRAPCVLRSNHGKVCVLNGDKGQEAYFYINVTVPSKSRLSFDFKSDTYFSDFLKIIIDDKTYKVPHEGYGKTWQKSSIELLPGQHKITWKLPKAAGSSSSLLNVIYIDNISIVKDEVAFLEIYPKGLQETYTDGMGIKFKAVPMRADRSVIEGLSVSYSVSGCGNIDKDGLFKPFGKGTCTVTATAGGKTATKSDIKVHGRDYLSDPVTIAGYTFTGLKGVSSGANLDTENIKFDYTQTPMSENFKADGFFVLQGNTKERLYIIVEKEGTAYKANYFVRKEGDFYKRIWLRFGPGKYRVSIAEAPDMKLHNTGNSLYEGDLIKTGTCPIVKTLTVQNTNPLPEEDAMCLMPSEVVQAESFYVSNIAHSILSGLPKDAPAGDKLRAIHDWELYNHYYDMVSVNHVDQRKRQDAEAVLKYHMGVCEGYANLYAALVRNAGIKAKVICDPVTLKHAWNHVSYNGQWYLVDVTWDDPIPSGAGDDYSDFSVGRENYTYFMTNHTDDKHIVAGTPDPGRTAVSVSNEGNIPKMTGMPDGWY